MKFVSTSPRVAVIFNPKGGSAKDGLIGELKAALNARGIDLVQYNTSAAPGSACTLARQASRDGAELVIACGGDGTVCQVAQGLMESKTPMAVLPAGTGNLFARAFYARPEPAKLAELIFSGQPQAVDMTSLKYRALDGSEHEQLYLVALGLGKISDAISGASPEMKRRFGKLTYVVRVLKACFNPHPTHYTFTAVGVEGEAFSTSTVASVVFALNALPPSMATLSRGCNASDGLTDIVALRATGFFSLLRLSSHLVSGRPDLSPHYFRLRARQVRIETDRPVSPNIDGDAGPLTRSLQITTLPQAVRVIVS